MLTKINAALMSGVLEHKHEAAQQRKEIRTLSSIQEEHVASVKVDFESVLKERDSEIRNLQLTIKQGRSSCDVEKN
jgi:hypothetical protein